MRWRCPLRRKPFAVLLTEQEKAEIEAAAKAAGVSASAYLRDSALARARGVPEMAAGEAEPARD
jgi:uncharacterized protein with beta-barrel porin domain